MISEPILFNCWKHHSGFIKSRIDEVQKGAFDSFHSIIAELLSIGESQMDLYTGNLEPGQIADEIIEYLKKTIVFYPDSFKKWLKENGKKFRTIAISDNSTWVMLQGGLKERYIHIHPGRYSLNSLRVKANTLKTAVALLCWIKINGFSEIHIETINFIRRNYLKLSPVKSIDSCSGLELILNLLNSPLS